MGVWLLGWLSAVGAAEPATNIPQPYCLLTNVGQPAWSPDGRQIAYAVYRNPLQFIEIMDLAARTNRIVVEDAFQPEWSPDGRWIAYQRDRMVYGLSAAGGIMRFSEAMVISPQGGRPRFIYPGARPHWSADGQRLFVVDESARQVVVSRVKQPEDQPPVIWQAPHLSLWRVSPDGRRMAVQTNDNIAVYLIEKKELEFLIPAGAPGNTAFVWGPDSASLVVTLTGNVPEASLGLWWVDLQAPKIQRLAKGEWLMAASPLKEGLLAAVQYCPIDGRLLWVFPGEWVKLRKAERVPVFEPPVKK